LNSAPLLPAWEKGLGLRRERSAERDEGKLTKLEFSMVAESSNFEFLRRHNPQLVRLGALAEHFYHVDPNTCLIKLRQFAELLAQSTAARMGLYVSTEESQVNLLRRLRIERAIPDQVADLFHQIRIVGNEANHEYTGNYSEALTTLKMARQLAIWFHRTFSRDRTFRPEPFVPPQNPANATAELIAELEGLRASLEQTRTEAERAQLAAEAQAQALCSAEEKARQEAEERRVWEELATEAEQARSALTAQLAALQAAAQQLPHQQTAALIDRAESAAQSIDLDEAQTRALIDQQLRDAGWVVDTNVFATNGRPYLRQLETESGIWFRDVRKATNHRRALADWPTPEGLDAQLGMDQEAAHVALKAQPYQFGFPLRSYQQRAIATIEQALEQDRRSMLVAMATGTGKTKLAIASHRQLLDYTSTDNLAV
jgi:type I restriction enzyme R subunit